VSNIAKATAALQESVHSIIGCDENDAIKREALVETFGQFQDYMAKADAERERDVGSRRRLVLSDRQKGTALRRRLLPSASGRFASDITSRLC
jgi:hypothetical protein